MDTCTPWTHLPVLLKGLYRSFLCIACYKNSFHLEFIFYIGSVQGVLSVQKTTPFFKYIPEKQCVANNISLPHTARFFQ